MNFAPTCVDLQPYEGQDLRPPNNTCAWLAGNYSTAAKSNISTCCGPSNPIYISSLSNTQPYCFEMCNITSNGTTAELAQNGETLLKCLYGALHAANAGWPHCSFDGPQPPKKNDAWGLELSWVKVGAVAILVGTALCGL